MSSLIKIKPQILYAPMLASFGGGSSRGFGRGTGGGGGLDWTFVFRGDSAVFPSRFGKSYAELRPYQTAAPFYNDTSLFNVTTLGYQDVLITTAGNYKITATGGSNNKANSASGSAKGYGAVVEATFALAENSALRIVVGSSSENTSGAGGSFVFYKQPGTFTADPLSLSSVVAFNLSTLNNHILIAAGGAGGMQSSGSNSLDSTSANGAQPTFNGAGQPSGGNSTNFGTNGAGGGYAGSGYSGAGGAGITGHGTQAYEASAPSPTYPVKYDDGFVAGDRYGSYGQGVAGFGGGATGSYAGSGGGGYSGGSGDYSNGAGGSQHSGGGGGSKVNTTGLAATYVSGSTYSLSSGGNGSVYIRPA